MDNLSRSVLRWQQTRDERTITEIITSCEPIIRASVTRVCPLAKRMGLDDDLHARGQYAVWVAAGRFTEAKGKFGSWAFQACRWHMIDYLRLENHRRRPWLLFADLNGPDGEPQAVEAYADPGAADPADIVADTEQAERLAAAVERCPQRERHVLARRYFDGETLMVVADDLGVSRARVGQIERIALERLRKIPLSASN